MKHLAHAADPDTSHEAAVTISASLRATLKDAILTMLAERPRTADELVAAYRGRAEIERWPLIQDLHSVKRRLSELHTRHHVVADSGERRNTRMGRPSVVWALAVPVDEARLIVAGA